MLNTAVINEYFNIFTWFIYGNILKFILKADVKSELWWNFNNEMVSIEVCIMQRVLVW